MTSDEMAKFINMQLSEGGSWQIESTAGSVTEIRRHAFLPEHSRYMLCRQERGFCSDDHTENAANIIWSIIYRSSVERPQFSLH